MCSRNLLQQIFGLMLVVLLLTGCGGVQVGLNVTPTPLPPTSTSTPIPPTTTPTSVPPTPTLEPPRLQIGDTFTMDSYEVKLVQVEERPVVIAATSDKIGSTDPVQDQNTWLVLAIEITNTGNITAPLTLLASDSAVVGANGQTSELSSTGVSVEADNGFVFAFINEQKLTRGFLVSGANGRIFVTPDGSQKLLVGGASSIVIGDPVGPQWDLGELSPEGTAKLSLLFEVPAEATGLTWQFLGSSLLSLPQPQTESLPEEQGPSMTLSMVDSELCQLADFLKLECP